MNPGNSNDPSPSSQSGGMVRIVLAICVLALAGLGILFVLDVLPREQFTDLSVKAVTIGAIALVSSVALGLLARR